MERKQNQKLKQKLIDLVNTGSKDIPLQDILVSRAKRYLCDHHEAEDAVQDVMVSLLEGSLNLYDISRPFKPWITKKVTNRCLDVLRSKKRNRVLNLAIDTDDETYISCIVTNDSLDPVKTLIRDEKLQTVRSDIDSLPEPYRRSMASRHINGDDYDTIADFEGIPTGTVKSRLNSGKTMIRNKIMNRLIVYRS